MYMYMYITYLRHQKNIIVRFSLWPSGLDVYAPVHKKYLLARIATLLYFALAIGLVS